MSTRLLSLVRFVHVRLPPFSLQDFVHLEEAMADDDQSNLESTMEIVSSRLLLYVRALTHSVPALMADVLNRGLCLDITHGQAWGWYSQ